MAIDLLLLVVGLGVLGFTDPAWRSAWRGYARQVGAVLGAGLGATARSIRGPLLFLAALFALSQWAQGVWRFGPGFVLETVLVGNLEERAACFAHQHKLAETKAALAFEQRCPLGGGVYPTDAPGLRCDVHGRAP